MFQLLMNFDATTLQKMSQNRKAAKEQISNWWVAKGKEMAVSHKYRFKHEGGS